MTNIPLRTAQKVKNDEFYTLYEDIEKELAHYKQQLEGKIVYCNCDNPKYSNFWKYFKNNFKELKLKRLFATYYNGDNNSFIYWYDGENVIKGPLKGNGDFRSDECIDVLKIADVIITNPPFSLFMEYIDQLVEYDKQFLIIGNKNAIPYKNVFPLIKDNKIIFGYNKIREFATIDGETAKMNGLVRWFSNIDTGKVIKPLPLTKSYFKNKDEYPRYDNYDAINVNSLTSIPKDYYGKIGVPITFIDKYCPEQFEIINCITRYEVIPTKYGNPKGTYATNIDGKSKFARIIIKRRTQ